MLETLLIAVIGSLLSMMAPGPNLVAVAATALGTGRREAVVVAAGVSVGTMVWVLFAAFGFGALLAAKPALLAGMKVLGGGYLTWLAFKILHASLKPNRRQVAGRRVSQSLAQHFFYGLMVVGANPKALLLWASVSTFLFGAGFSTWWVALFGPVAAVLSFINYGIYAVVFSSELHTARLEEPPKCLIVWQVFVSAGLASSW